eukprot:TRINITY_DN16683_c0_g1_i1.p1 TRINITY_DN16683_c0_g1~~TRINITY_DN16683_c0_g1_i1.p1  ORF type:complete len:1146 (+),score=352.80 TRINITY_DN16683_c0_g1_i1:85-3438(+)
MAGDTVHIPHPQSVTVTPGPITGWREHLYEQPLAVLHQHYSSTLDLQAARQPLFKPKVGPPSLMTLRGRRPRKQRSHLPAPTCEAGVRVSPSRCASRGADGGRQPSMLPQLGRGDGAATAPLPPGEDFPSPPLLGDPAPLSGSLGLRRGHGGRERSPVPVYCSPRSAASGAASARSPRGSPRRDQRDQADDWGLWGDPEPECGFDRLVGSLQRLLPKIERDGFADKWAEVAEWISKYDCDRDQHYIGAHADAEFYHVLQANLLRSSVGQEQKDELGVGDIPSKDMLSTACVMLDVLLSTLVRSSPKLLSACRQSRSILMRALFASKDAADAVSVPNLTGATFPEKEWKQAKAVYAGRRPYGTLVDDVMRKLGMAAEDVEAGERKAERLIAVMDRGMAFWKGELRKCIVRVWRAHVRVTKYIAAKVKKLGEVEKHNANLEEALKQVQEKLAATLVSASEETTMLREKLAESRAAREQAEQEHKGYMGRIAQLIEEEQEKVQRVNNELQSQVALLTSQQEDFCTICKDFTMSCMEGPQWEAAQQERLGHLVGARTQETTLEACVLEWLNACIGAVEGIDAEKCKVASFADGHQMFGAYVIAMHFMSPERIKREEVDAILQPQDVQEKAKRVLELVQQMDLSVGVRLGDLINPNARAQHALLAAALMQRFCDPALARACSQRQLVGSTPDGWEHPLWPRAQVLRSSAEWRARIEQGWERAQRWRALGAAANSFALDTMINIIQGGGAERLSEKEQEDRALYVDDPLPAELPPSPEAEETAEPLLSPVSPTSPSARRGSASDAKLADLLPSDPFARQKEAEQVRGVLSAHYRVVRNVFLYYATADVRSVDQELSAEEVWRLLSDCKLTSAKDSKNGLARTLVDDLVRRSAGRSNAELQPTHFCRLLIRLAAARVKGPLPLSEKLDTLLTRHILPYCNYSDADEFRQLLYTPNVQGVLGANGDLALACFRGYGRSGARGGWVRKETAADRRLTLDEFCQLATDLTITDSILTHDAVKHIFMKLGSPSAAPASPEPGSPTSETSESHASGMVGITYQGFLECLCGIAAFKTPAPYLPLFKRISRFFEMWFVPILSDSSRFKAVHGELDKLQKAAAAKAQQPQR